MLIKIIKSVFNFYMLCVQPFIGLVLAGYGAWKFSGDSISALLEKERSKEEEFKSSIKPEDFVK
ncbi:hypothetical protein UPC42_004037 [Escherichia coli]|nr:hypothetical protein [Escherichia coli]